MKERTLRELTEDLTYRDMIKRENERNFQDIFFLNPLAMIITKTDGTVMKINEAMTRVFGYSKDDLYGKDVTPFYAHADDRKDVINILKKDGIMLHHPMLFYNKDKKIIPCIMSSKVIQIQGEDHFLTVLFDVKMSGKND